MIHRDRGVSPPNKHNEPVAASSDGKISYPRGGWLFLY
jgi:hypothetical protein